MCDGFLVIHPIWKCNLRARDKVFFNKNESCNAFHHCWVQFGNIPGGARCHAATAQKQLSQRQHPLQKSKNMSFAHGGHRAWQSQIRGWFIKGHLNCLKTPCLLQVYRHICPTKNHLSPLRLWTSQKSCDIEWFACSRNGNPKFGHGSLLMLDSVATPVMAPRHNHSMSLQGIAPESLTFAMIEQPCSSCDKKWCDKQCTCMICLQCCKVHGGCKVHLACLCNHHHIEYLLLSKPFWRCSVSTNKFYGQNWDIKQ